MKDTLNAILKELELREAHTPIGAKTKRQDEEKQRETSRQRHMGSESTLHSKHESCNEESTNGKAKRKCVYCLGEHKPEECKKITKVYLTTSCFW
ncbi:uncharacterized protein LOC124447925 isoform X2 [Xenia sp. Carnegie-2017]|uniref:uncharacterized protein LOC124447925 isoform X2 n=1 Tax=Xenia sp. Carnegie-2017 TaxID=2897299 RepID=UPI001F03C232|nr:uncharacterized protein LOC124447925 isoform X2 [Xenia sp. Carnegie-2017]